MVRSISKASNSRASGSSRGPKLPAALAEQLDLRPQHKPKSRPHRRRPTEEPYGRIHPNYIPPNAKRAAAPSSERGFQIESSSTTNRSSPPSKHERSDSSVRTSKRRKKYDSLPHSSLRLDAFDSTDPEDEEIAWLEYALGSKERGSGDLDDDGLDDILEIADRIGTERPRDLHDADTDSDLELSENQSAADEDSDPTRSATTIPSVSARQSGPSLSHIDHHHHGGASQKSVSPPSEQEAAGHEERASTTEPSEPSGRARYVPPHLRNSIRKVAPDDKQPMSVDQLKLKRKIHGLLNRLSELNLDSILAGLEEAYHHNSRHDVSETITNAILEMIASQITLLESFVILYATLISAVHRIIGNEFGKSYLCAAFVHNLVSKYQEAISPTFNNDYNSPEDVAASSFRESMNLLALIGELYNAQVLSANLIFDLVRQFLGSSDSSFAEQHVEGLLRLLRSCGPQLRSDDPQNLKDIASSLVQRFSGKEKQISPRTAFMIETVQGLQSGKAKSMRTDVDAVTRMKKYLGNLGRTRRLLATEPLRVSLSDLMDADTRGRWWLVGAGWAGDPLVERKVTATKQQGNTEQERLIAAAKKQGFNTEIRRAIFTILMTSDDYNHACDRLSAAKMTETQQREYIRVTLQCCGSESEYNPYYTLILQRLCALSTSHRFTLQYALWDFFRELGEDVSETPSSHSQAENQSVSNTRIANMARAVAFLIARTSLDLTILKVLDFTQLQKRTIAFLRRLFACLFIGVQTQSALFLLPKSFDERRLDQSPIEDSFTKVLSNLEFVQGLSYFLQTHCSGKEFSSIAEQYGTKAEKVARRSVAVAIGILQ